MKSIKEHFSEYGFLSLLVVPVFFIISYLFNVVYFFAFGVSLSQIPLAVSDYIMSVNILGIVILWGITVQIISVIIAKHLETKDLSSLRREGATLKNNMDGLTKLINKIKKDGDDETIKMEMLQQAENDLRKIEEDVSNISRRTETKITTFKIVLFIVSMLSIFTFVYLISTKGIFHAQFFLLMLPICFTSMFFCIQFDTISTWLILVFFTCLTYSLDDALSKALDNYKSDSVDVTTSNNKYFNMRSFENGFWVKNAETGEVLFITKAGDILNFHQPKRIIKHLADEKYD